MHANPRQIYVACPNCHKNVVIYLSVEEDNAQGVTSCGECCKDFAYSIALQPVIDTSKIEWRRI